MDRQTKAMSIGARVNGRMTQRHIAYVVGFTESQVPILAQRMHTWKAISEKLDSLKLSRDDRRHVEAQLSAKLGAAPSKAQLAKFDRENKKAMEKWISRINAAWNK